MRNRSSIFLIFLMMEKLEIKKNVETEDRECGKEMKTRQPTLKLRETYF